MKREIASDAAEFGRFIKHGGGWQYGLMVARNTFKGKATDKINTTSVALGKVSTEEFGERAGVNVRTVQRYRNIWEAQAEQTRGMPLADELKPGDEVDLSKLPKWPGDRDPRAGTPERHVAKKDVEITPARAKTAYLTDPAVRTAINKAAIEEHEAAVARTRAKQKAVKTEREARGEPEALEPVTPVDPMLSQMDGVIEEAQRREELDKGEALAAELEEWAKNWAETYGYTGVEDEVEQVHRISAHITEAQWKVTAFAVEQEEDAQ